MYKYNIDMTRKLLTTRERILIHLLRYSSKRLDDYMAPRALTQDGIGEAVGVGRNNVPREINKLIKDGFVDYIKAHVNGFRNKRTVYFLTTKGIMKAKEIMEKVRDLTLKVIDFSGNEVSIKLTDVPKQYGIDITTAALNVDKNKTLDLMKLLVKRGKNVRIVEIDLKLQDFYGRRDELLKFKKWYNSDKRILVITGMSGVGKTAFMKKAINEYVKNRDLLWLEIREWRSAEDIILKIAEFYSKLGHNDLEKYIRVSMKSFERAIEWENIYAILKKISKNEIIIFDGVEYANENVKKILPRLLEIVDALKELRIILIGSSINVDMPNTTLPYMDEIVLDDLPEEDAIALLMENGISYEDAHEIYAQYGGNPLFLKLISKNGSVRIIKKYFLQSILESLSPEEIKVVEYASVFRKSFKMNALLLMDVHYAIVYSLVNRNILMEMEDGSLFLHTIIRNFVYESLPTTRKKEYHLMAARYLFDEGELLEAIYHYTMGNEILLANRLLLENYRKFIQRGEVENVRFIAREILNRYDESVEDHEWYLYGIIGDTYEISEDWEDAIDNYTKAFYLSKNKDVDYYAWVSVKLAELFAKQGSYESAMEYISEAFKCVEKIKDETILARAHYVLGMILVEIGEYEEAEDNFMLANEISARAADYQMRGYALNGLALLKRKNGDIESAIELLNEAKHFFEIAGDLRGLGKVLSNLGRIYYDSNDMDLAENYIKEAQSIFRKIGDLWSLATSKIVLAGIFTYREKYDVALRYYKEAEKIFSKTRSVVNLSKIYMGYGYIYSAINKPENAKKYFDKAIDLVAKTGNEKKIVEMAGYAKDALSKYEHIIDIKQYEKIKTGEIKIVGIVNK